MGWGQTDKVIYKIFTDSVVIKNEKGIGNFNNKKSTAKLNWEQRNSRFSQNVLNIQTATLN